MISQRIDIRDVLQGLQRLGGPGKESLARRMGAGAGRVIRDEAKRLAPQGKAEHQAMAQFGGSQSPGLLESAIYVAYNEQRSSQTVFTYSVSWNRQRAPHGHLLEFGHWRPYAIYYSPRYGWRTDKSRKLAAPKWVAAHPFLGPSYHSSKQPAFEVAITIGRREFPRILAGEAE